LLRGLAAAVVLGLRDEWNEFGGRSALGPGIALTFVNMESFWELMAWHHSPSEDGFARLTRALSSLDAAHIEAFAASLEWALVALSTPAHAARRVRDASEPDGSAALPMSQDVFLYARCAIVAQGRATWEQVVADPTALDQGWDIAGGEELLEVVPEAYERVTGLVWAPQDVDPAPLSGWLSHSESFDRAVRHRPVFEWVTDHLVQAMNADNAWFAWWRHADKGRLEIDAFYSWEENPRSRIRVGRGWVRVEFSTYAAILDPSDHEILEKSARRALIAAVELAQAKLRLGPLPDLPQIPRAPADLPDVERDSDADVYPSDEELVEIFMAGGMSRDEAFRSASARNP
jgi:hypothetical protein